MKEGGSYSRFYSQVTVTAQEKPTFCCISMPSAGGLSLSLILCVSDRPQNWEKCEIPDHTSPRNLNSHLDFIRPVVPKAAAVHPVCLLQKLQTEPAVSAFKEFSKKWNTVRTVCLYIRWSGHFIYMIIFLLFILSTSNSKSRFFEFVH